MKIEETKNGGNLIVKVSERLDTTTAPELEKYLSTALEDVTDLSFDFADLDYMSSAGLRVLLMAIKKMAKQGNMVVKNANETVKDVFEVTGFIDLMTVE